tara:strand:- start:12997 stop:14898 length:1902 start_codon:yes stop_codon:yes gene_type:complete
VLQYPLRPVERPYDIGDVTQVRYKPKSGKLEIELPKTGEASNVRNVDTEAAQNLKVDKRVLVSTESPVHEGYVVACMKDGALHITPVDAAFQMRPSLAHLDAADDRRKQEDLSATGVKGNEKLAGVVVVDDETEAAKETAEQKLKSENAPFDTAPSLVPLQVQVKRRETERQTEMRLHSHAYLKQLEEDEQWSKLTPVADGHAYAVAARERIVTVAGGAANTSGRSGKRSGNDSMDFAGPAGVPITAAAYLDAMCPINGDQLGSGLVGDDGGGANRDNTVSGFAGGLSKAQLESLPLAQRVHALFAKGQRTVLRFSRVMHFAPTGSDPEEVIAALKGVAHLVQGCWVAASALRCGGDARRERVRDHALYHFVKAKDVKLDAFGRGVSPPPPPGELPMERLRREVLSELAVPRVAGARGGTKGAAGDSGDGSDSGNEWWSFSEQTDVSFMEKYPQLVKDENERWRSLSPWLELDFHGNNSGAAEKLQPPPQPPFVSNSVAVAAKTLILPNIQKEGVVRLSFIRQQLERSGSNELTSLSLLREPEILGILGPNVVAIDGLCCLKTIRDASIDPFREFLLSLLRKRGRAVRRTDVMEGAAAALGAAPTNAVYTKCLSDLCVSRGSTWVMKTGNEVL